MFGKYLLDLLSVCLMLVIIPISTAQAAGPDELAEGLVNPGYVEKPAWFKESFLDIRDDLADAAANGKRLLLYFYQDGCPYCERLINENMSQQDIVEQLKKDFDVIAINMWGDREVTGLDGKETTEKAFAVANRIMFTPTLVFLNEKGEQVLRLNGYYPPHKFKVALDYVSGKLENREKYRDYLARIDPKKASGELHTEHANIDPPYDLSKLGRDKPLIVMFEQKQCPACDELHDDILMQAGSPDLLDRFDIVVLDMWAKTPVVTPDGEKTTAAAWARKLKIDYAPSMVFFDQGREVFRTEAWLRTFHVQSALDYVSSRAYRKQPEFQRYVETRGDALREQGVEVDLMK